MGVTFLAGGKEGVRDTNRRCLSSKYLPTYLRGEAHF